VGDVGLTTYEEVNLVTQVGQNFGWSTHEGPCQSSCAGFTDAITSYTRTDEDPYIVEGNDRPLEPGHAFSIEPGIYFDGQWGIRLEDIVVVGADGLTRCNNASRHLAEV